MLTLDDNTNLALLDLLIFSSQVSNMLPIVGPIAKYTKSLRQISCWYFVYYIMC